MYQGNTKGKTNHHSDKLTFGALALGQSKAEFEK